MPEVWATFIFVDSGRRDGVSFFVPNGLYETHAQALANCRKGNGVAKLRVGEPFPLYVNELPCCYNPWVETWENSAAFKAQVNAVKIVAHFFEGATK